MEKPKPVTKYVFRKQVNVRLILFQEKKIDLRSHWPNRCCVSLRYSETTLLVQVSLFYCLTQIHSRRWNRLNILFFSLECDCDGDRAVAISRNKRSIMKRILLFSVDLSMTHSFRTNIRLKVCVSLCIFVFIHKIQWIDSRFCPFKTNISNDTTVHKLHIITISLGWILFLFWYLNE